MLQVLDYFFLIFHTLFTLFNITGWIFTKTRKIHFITLTLTAFSWFILGIWYGWGYCFCTDWHWQVRAMLGKAITSNSYIHFLIVELTGIDLSESLVSTITLTVFLFSSAMSIFLNIRDWKKKLYSVKKNKKPL